MKMMEAFIEPDGTITYVYSDLLAKVFAGQGETKTQRASHVEPTADNRWTADMSPVEPGVVLGPFDTHEEAITAEVAFLHKRMIAGPVEVQS
jgi:hypothetical protein